MVTHTHILKGTRLLQTPHSHHFSSIHYGAAAVTHLNLMIITHAHTLQQLSPHAILSFIKCVQRTLHITVYLCYLCQNLLSKWRKCWSALLSSVSIILQTWMKNNLGIDWIIMLAAVFIQQSNSGHNTTGTGLSVAKGRKVISWRCFTD